MPSTFYIKRMAKPSNSQGHQIYPPLVTSKEPGSTFCNFKTVTFSVTSNS